MEGFLVFRILHLAASRNAEHQLCAVVHQLHSVASWRVRRSQLPYLQAMAAD